jgi:biotin transport system substrate-specific component
MGAAVVAVALAAQVTLPMPGGLVPQSLQTLAVVLAGAWLGPARGGMALVLYVVVGAVGAPVFADGASGAEHLLGPTAGYLAGFVVAAVGMGWWFQQRWSRGFAGVFAGALAAHAVILGVGWLHLAEMMGVTVAFAAGVAPFLVGGLVKSVVAAGVLVLVPRPEGADAAPDDESTVEGPAA